MADATLRISGDTSEADQAIEKLRSKIQESLRADVATDLNQQIRNIGGSATDTANKMDQVVDATRQLNDTIMTLNDSTSSWIEKLFVVRNAFKAIRLGGLALVLPLAKIGLALGTWTPMVLGFVDGLKEGIRKADELHESIDRLSKAWDRVFGAARRGASDYGEWWMDVVQRTAALTLDAYSKIFEGIATIRDEMLPGDMRPGAQQDARERTEERNRQAGIKNPERIEKDQGIAEQEAEQEQQRQDRANHARELARQVEERLAGTTTERGLLSAGIGGVGMGAGIMGLGGLLATSGTFTAGMGASRQAAERRRQAQQQQFADAAARQEASQAAGRGLGAMADPFGMLGSEFFRRNAMATINESMQQQQERREQEEADRRVLDMEAQSDAEQRQLAQNQEIGRLESGIETNRARRDAIIRQARDRGSQNLVMTRGAGSAFERIQKAALNRDDKEEKRHRQQIEALDKQTDSLVKELRKLRSDPAHAAWAK